MSLGPDPEDTPAADPEVTPATDPGATPPATTATAPRRRTTILTVVGVFVVLLFAVVVAAGVQTTTREAPQRPSAAPVAPVVPPPGLVVPAGATPYGVTLGKPEAPAAIDVYIDFQCPFCREFELASGATLAQMIATGQARVTYHPLSFFDRFSSTEYSSRSAAAAGCAIEAKVYPRFQTLLFDQQPPEGGVGLPDERIIALGRQAGAGEQFDGCVRAHRYAPWISTVTAQATHLGVDSTPTLQVNGQTIEHSDQALREAVRSTSG